FDHRFDGHRLSILRVVGSGVGVHQLGKQVLIEGTPVDPDAHRLVVLNRLLDDGAKVVVPPLGAYVAGIDAKLVQHTGRLRIFRKEKVSVVVEVTDDGNAAALPSQPLNDVRHRLGGRVVVDGDAHQLAAGVGQGTDLLDGRVHVGRIRIGHRLNHDRVVRSEERRV